METDATNPVELIPIVHSAVKDFDHEAKNTVPPGGKKCFTSVIIPWTRSSQQDNSMILEIHEMTTKWGYSAIK